MRLSRALQNVVLSSVCALSALSAEAINLLVNSGFELPGTSYQTLPRNSTTIGGWTTVLAGVKWFDATAYGGAAEAS
jgi:hypothetical protein